MIKKIYYSKSKNIRVEIYEKEKPEVSYEIELDDFKGMKGDIFVDFIKTEFEYCNKKKD